MKYHINLVSRKELSVVDKTLYFFLNYVRYILVITQLTVIGVLFFRFKIDQSIIDLKDSIDTKKEIIKVFQPQFQDADKINTQIGNIKTILNEQELQNASINYLLARFPRDAFLKRFVLENGVYTLSGITIDAQALRDYYLTLQKEAKFKSVQLSNIKRDIDGYTFTLTASKFTL